MKVGNNTQLKDKISNKYEKTGDTGVIKEIRDSANISLACTDDKIDSRIIFFKNYMTEFEADDLYNSLIKELNWQQREGVNSFGGTYFEPRMTYWFGKPYKYSTVAWNENNEWNKRLDDLRIRLINDQELFIDPEKELNSVMCNYYRSGNDSIGWHADDETSLGRCPTIASISLGETRYFDVCKREEYHTRKGKPMTSRDTFAGCTEMYRFHLSKGSLLLMTGAVQDNWLHRVPRSGSAIDGRINLTFRYIVDKEEEKKEIEYKRQQAKARRLEMVKNLPRSISDMSIDKQNKNDPIKDFSCKSQSQENDGNKGHSKKTNDSDEARSDKYSKKSKKRDAKRKDRKSNERKQSSNNSDSGPDRPMKNDKNVKISDQSRKRKHVNK